MPLFLFPHDEDEQFDSQELQRVLGSSATELVARPGVLFEWTSEEGIACELAADRDAIWTAGDSREDFAYLVTLAGKLDLDSDMSDHDYSFHVHVHEHADVEECWTAREQG